MTSDTRHIQSRQGLRWTILAYAIGPVPFYLYLVVMSSWGLAQDAFAYDWIEWVGFAGAAASLLCASGFGIYVFIALTKINALSKSAFWPITKIHLRTLFGSLMALLVPASFISALPNMMSKFQQTTAGEPMHGPIIEISFLAAVVLMVVVSFQFVSWGLSLLGGIPTALKKLTAPPNESPS